MRKRQLVISIFLSLASLAVSGGFAVYGTAIVRAEEMEGWLVALGIAVAMYGIGSFVALLMAWRFNRGLAKKVISYLAPTFMVMALLGCLDTGMISGLEFGLLFGLLLMVSVNYFAVTVVANSRGVT